MIAIIIMMILATVLNSMFSGDVSNNRVVLRNVKTTYLVPISLSWRHFIPLDFVFTLLEAILFSFLFPMWGWLSIVCILSPYRLLDLYFSHHASRRLREPAALVVLFAIYPLFYLFYECGSLVSLLILPLWRRTGRGEQQA